MVTTPSFTDGTWQVVSTAHFSGNPNADILWQNIADQSLVLWEQDGPITTAATALPSLKNYVVTVVGDFDGDGVGDPLLRSGSANRLLLSSTDSISATFSSTWAPAATADLNVDGKSDIILIAPDSTRITARTMDGTTQTGSTTMSTGYSSGDSLLSVYNATGIKSFASLWFDQSANSYDLTNYANGVRSVTGSFNVSASRPFAGQGDYNGDGNIDFLFVDPSGAGEGSFDVVFTNGSNVVGRASFSNEFRGIVVENGGDFDGDGQFELLVRNLTTEQLFVANVVGGTASANTLYGTTGSDFIDGQEGNDTIWGEAGDDFLLGGQGDDQIFGGEGHDMINGGEGNNALHGNAGNDTITSGAGDDYIDAGAGDDRVNSGPGFDIIVGGDGDDYLVGGAFGFVHIRGGNGNDIIIGDDNGIYEGGPGDDYIVADNGLDYLFGGDGNDFLVGGLSSDTVNGGNGDDIIFGTDIQGLSNTTDILIGGPGNDYFYLGNEDTKFYTGSGEAIIKDYSQFADKIVLSGFASDYNYNDLGNDIQIRLSSNNNVIATVEGALDIAAVQAGVIFIG